MRPKLTEQSARLRQTLNVFDFGEVSTKLEEQSRKCKFWSNLTLDILLMNSKYYFYILSCNNHTRYYGHTNNLTKRLNEHLKGRVQFTRDKQPLELVYYKEFNSRSEAFKREMQFKNGKTREKTIGKLINSFPKTKCQGFNSRIQFTSTSFRKLCAH